MDLKDSVARILSQDLPDTINGLKDALTASQKLTEPLLKARCQAHRTLQIERNRLRLPKSKEYTDFDRETMLNADTALLNEEYQYLLGLEERLNRHIDILALLVQFK